MNYRKKAMLMAGALLCLNLSIYSQSISLKMSNVSVKKAMTELQTKSGYSFVYIAGDVDTDRTVSINASQLKDAVAQILKGQNVSYEIQGKNIVIKKGSQQQVTSGKRKKVTGTVKDANGEPIIGATVVEKGTTNGTVTDFDGNYTLELSESGTLAVSYIGYKSQEFAASQIKQGALAVTLKEDTEVMDEVVVVGYGSVKRSDVTGSVSSLDAESLTAASQTNAIDAMQGKISGVNITRNAARPGGSYNIVVRGLSSINNSNAPLWVIDGIPTNSDASDINPADIEKIDVLKDASATAIYGSRGANGVIIVTTKRGKEGRVSINYDGYWGIRKASNLPDMMNMDEYIKFRTEMFQAQGKSTDRSNAEFFTPEEWERIDSGTYTDWVDLILCNGQQYSNTITASGGNADGTFSIGLGQLHEEGTIPNQDFDRYNMHLNLNHKFSKIWEAGGSLYFTHSVQNIGSYEALRSAYRLPGVAYPYDEEGNLVYNVYRNDMVNNPLLESGEDGEQRQNKRFRVFGNIYLQVNPIDGLTLRSQFAPQMIYKREGVYMGGDSKESGGKLEETKADYNQTLSWSYVWDNQVTYDKLFGLHHLNLSFVQSIQMEEWEYSNQSAKSFSYNSAWYNLGASGLSNATKSTTNFEKRTLASFLGRVQYSYNDRYLLTLSGRYDGSSRLSAGNQWSFFPSAALAWRVSEEDFLNAFEQLSNLKLRVSYGATGNDAVDIYGTQSGISLKNYDFGGITVPAYYKDRLANRDLSWEKTYEINVGVDFGFFNSRINGAVDVYRRDAKNLIMERKLPSTSGWTSIWDNIGHVRNVGVELQLNTVNVQTKDFTWETGFTFSKNHNELIELYGGKKDDVTNKWFIGEPIDVNYDYVFDGIWQSDEAEQAAVYGQKPGQVKVRDIDGNKVINADDKQILGQRSPKWIGSITSTFRYKDFDLSVYLYTQQGAQVQDAFMSSFMTFEGNYNQLDVNYWTENNPSNEFPQPGNKGQYYDAMRYVDVSFVRVGSITLGWNIPKDWTKKIGIKNARLYFTSNNPFTFSSYKGFDPEWATQNTWGTVTGYTTYLLGTKIEF
ncbi:TonB-dependent receptor [Phocaeicola plebeius]|uniref:TonB-dependent receptor n=1 Tax=Phocaeicola plebeius TaxID=310297 RepID=UPI0026F134CD|nr:TonB-dependent receptor [Phocaeicola plebeius]